MIADASSLQRVEHEVAQVLAETEAPVEVYDATLQAIGSSLGWQVGAVWELSRDDGRLHCVRRWHNLIRTPAGCGFSAKGTDRLGKAAGLGSLRWNGGPTQTMALSKGSAARNAIGVSACAVKRDERGVRRPQGGRCDIGAYERRVK